MNRIIEIKGTLFIRKPFIIPPYFEKANMGLDMRLK
jgi:hypothetical protein